MKSFKVLIFSLNNQEYAIDIDYVERIIGYNNVTKVINSEIYIDGIVEYEEKTLTIIDLIKFFNIKEEIREETDEKIVIITFNGFKIGLRVDSVIEVAIIEEEFIEPIPLIAIKNEMTPIKSVIKINQKIKILLDGHKIFALNKVKELM